MIMMTVAKKNVVFTVMCSTVITVDNVILFSFFTVNYLLKYVPQCYVQINSHSHLPPCLWWWDMLHFFFFWWAWRIVPSWPSKARAFKVLHNPYLLIHWELWTESDISQLIWLLWFLISSRNANMLFTSFSISKW